MLTAEQKNRYHRQLILPEFGIEGQLKLAGARVLIVGVGGLGSITAFYLTAAGVGHIRIVDNDIVTVGNLNRQLLHSTADLNRPKVESAAEKLNILNPECFIEKVYARFEDDNRFDLAEGCDLILDATDNLASRHVLNRVSLKRRIPLIYGGINGWNGKASTFLPGKTCCFACVIPEGEAKKKLEVIPALGPTTGVIASIQNMEAMKILLNIEPGLADRLLDFQGSRFRFRTVTLEKNPHCTVCG